MHIFIEFIIENAFYLLLFALIALIMYKHLFSWLGNKAYLVITFAIVTILTTIAVLAYTHQLKDFVISTLLAIITFAFIGFLTSFLFDPYFRALIFNKFKRKK